VLPPLERQSLVANDEKKWHQHAGRQEGEQSRNKRIPAEAECVAENDRGGSEAPCEQKNLIDPIHPLPFELRVRSPRLES